jgi:hypothetical protein
MWRFSASGSRRGPERAHAERQAVAAAGFELVEVVDMPANNLSVVLRKRFRRLEQANGELFCRYLDLRSQDWIPIGINTLLLLEASCHGYMLFAVTTRRLITNYVSERR